MSAYICLARKYRPQTFGIVFTPTERLALAARVRQIMGGVEISVDDAITHAFKENGVEAHASYDRGEIKRMLNDG